MNKSATAGDLDRATFLLDGIYTDPQSVKYNRSRLREMLQGYHNPLGPGSNERMEPRNKKNGPQQHCSGDID